MTNPLRPAHSRRSWAGRPGAIPRSVGPTRGTRARDNGRRGTGRSARLPAPRGQPPPEARLEGVLVTAGRMALRQDPPPHRPARAPAQPGARNRARCARRLPVITLATTGAGTGQRREVPPVGVPSGGQLAVIGTRLGSSGRPAGTSTCGRPSGRSRLSRLDRARRRPRSRRRRARGHLGARLPDLRRLPGVCPPDRSPADPCDGPRTTARRLTASSTRCCRSGNCSRDPSRVQPMATPQCASRVACLAQGAIRRRPARDET